MNPIPTQPTSSPIVRDADEAIRGVLSQWIHMEKQGDARGYNAASLAREFGVGGSQFARIMAGERYLHPGQIMRARAAIRAALLQAMASVITDAPTMSVEAEAFATLAVSGEGGADMARMLSDGVVDKNERSRLRDRVCREITQREKLVAAIDAQDARERDGATVHPIAAKGGVR